uniref:Uncharacterized protein n=1 Tax=Oryzias latipes TaxID=8090 RepID=A0A3P9KBU1_ORYLA
MTAEISQPFGVSLATVSKAYTVVVFPCFAIMGEKSVYDFFATSLDGQQIPLSTFRNKVLLIVNVATF